MYSKVTTKWKVLSRYNIYAGCCASKKLGFCSNCASNSWRPAGMAIIPYAELAVLSIFSEPWSTTDWYAELSVMFIGKGSMACSRRRVGAFSVDVTVLLGGCSADANRRCCANHPSTNPTINVPMPIPIAMPIQLEVDKPVTKQRKASHCDKSYPYLYFCWGGGGGAAKELIFE